MLVASFKVVKTKYVDNVRAVGNYGNCNYFEIIFHSWKVSEEF